MFLGLFRRPDPPPRDLLARQERLETAFRDLQLEWETVYTKFYRQVQRLNRVRDIEAPKVEEQTEAGTPLQRARRLGALRTLPRKGE